MISMWKKVVQCIKHEQLKAEFVEAIEGTSRQFPGKLDIDKLKTWKTSATVFTVTAGKNSQKQSISTQNKIAHATAEKGKIQFLKRTAKRIGKGRNLSFPVPARFVLDEVVGRWERGNPATYHELYLKKSKQFNDDPSHVLFKKRYLGEKKRSKFSTWLKRVLKRAGWTLRSKTVSQKIPSNWKDIAQEDSARICAKMAAAGVTVLINADETFIHFYPAEKKSDC